jgi:hypothetical protein
VRLLVMSVQLILVVKVHSTGSTIERLRLFSSW